MAFVFEQRAARGPLARWVESLWFARGRIAYAREHIAPTGAAVAVLNLGDPILHASDGPRASRLRGFDGWLSGPHDRPSLNEPLGETHCYGVVSTPVGCLALFGIEPRALRGRVVPLSEWSRGPRLRGALAGLEPDAGLRVLAQQLEAHGHAPPARVDRVARAVAWLEAGPALGVGEVARRLGLSHAYLDREFTRVVGLGPRRLAAILRVRGLLDGLDVFSDLDWVALSAEHGWYDQAHMIRDFKRYTGVTPSAYVRAQREHLDREEALDASGFVPLGPGSNPSKTGGA